MKKTIILRYGELALKGKNRGLFEKKLVENIKDCLHKNKIDGEIRKTSGRIFVYADESAMQFLKNIFGLVSLSPAIELENDFEQIKKKALEIAKKKDFATFRITTKRVKKQFPMHANDIDREIGALVADTLNKKVKLKDPDLEISIEILDKTYIFTEKIRCLGGLPLGITGHVVCLIHNKADILAAWLMAKRGCWLHLAVFDQVDTSILRKVMYGVRFTSQKTSTMKEAEKFLEQTKSKAFVTGQTLENFEGLDTDFTVLTPLIGYSVEEIESLEKNIADF